MIKPLILIASKDQSSVVELQGGTRGVAFLHSPLLKQSGFSSSNLMHGVDWLPTFMAAIGKARYSSRKSLPFQSLFILEIMKKTEPRLQAAPHRWPPLPRTV